MSATAWVKELPSFAASREQALAQAPRLVSIVLLALLALQLAMTLTRQPGTAPLPAATGAAAVPRPANTREVDLPAIVNAHLFGQKAAAPVSAGDAPASTMPLVLAGIYAVSDPNRGMAIIGQTATNARLVQVGGAIAGGAKLHAVYSDRVLIDRGGSLESVYLPKTPSSARPPPAAAAPAATGGQRLQAMAQAGTLLNGLVRLQAVTGQGKLLGFRVFPGGRNSAEVFGQLGLRAGDLITHVNGTALDDANRASEVMQTLTNASTASVTISRNGQPTEVNLNLTAVAQAAEAAVAADSAAATSAAGGAGFRGFAPVTGGANAAPGTAGGGTATTGGNAGRPPARFNRGNPSPNGN